MSFLPLPSLPSWFAGFRAADLLSGAAALNPDAQSTWPVAYPTETVTRRSRPHAGIRS